MVALMVTVEVNDGPMTFVWSRATQDAVRLTGCFTNYMDLLYPARQDVVLADNLAETYSQMYIDDLLSICGLANIAHS